MEKISIIIACYYSEGTISNVVNSIISEFRRQSLYDYEIILVNDGSKDHTYKIISDLAKDDPHIISINLSKNYGQLCAKMAGIHFVSGKYLVYLDDDGQCPIHQIFKLIEGLKEGFDVVYAGYTEKQTTFFKKVTSDIHGKLTEITLNKPKNIKISNFYAVNALMIDALKRYHSPFPSPLGYMLQITHNIKNIPMKENARLEGRSTYTLKKLFSQWLTVFTNFSLVPLRISASVGAIISVLGLILMIYYLFLKFTLQVEPGYTSIICISLFIGGIILLSLGLIGEYIGRIYMTICGKPAFVIKEIVDHKDNNTQRMEKHR